MLGYLISMKFETISMILFFDTFITDKPLTQSNVSANDRLRSKNNSYKMPSKIDIVKYTLTSYADLPWTQIIIRYAFSSEYPISQIKSFEKYVKSLYPRALIIHEQKSILTQKDFKFALDLINGTDDEWIFYSPNNDHPFIGSNLEGIYQGLATGNKFVKNNDYVSIVYSHYSEFIRAGFADSPFHIRYAQDAELIEDNSKTTSYLRMNGDNSSCQIVSKKLFNYWFNSRDLGSAQIIRAESIREHFLTHNQIMIVPKDQICAHFDGYSHTINSPTQILPSLIPPLFIPAGFFDRKIKIAYGYARYRKGWVNINPLSPKYVFEDELGGTDLKVLLSDLPLTWRGRVAKLDINRDTRWDAHKAARDVYYKSLYNPWLFSRNAGIITRVKRLASHYQQSKAKVSSVAWPETIAGTERLAQVGLLSRASPLELHIGCGARVLKGWINIDLFYTHYKDYLKYFKDRFYGKNVRGSRQDFYAFDLVNKPLPLSDGSVATIFHEDFIEHLDQKEQYIFLAETLRILKKGGVHRVNTPEITSSMKIHSSFDLGNVGVYKEEWDKHVHKNILSVAVITEMAKIVGYSKVIVQKRDVSLAKIPSEYRPDPLDRPTSGNIHIDLVK